MLYANLVVIFFVLVFLLIASFSDLKTRTISNKLILFFLVFGLMFNLLLIIYFRNYAQLLTLLYSVIISFVIFFLLWELGVIAGGDVKLFIALAFLIPSGEVTFKVLAIGQEKLMLLPIFPLLLFIVSVFMTLPWIFIYSKYLLFKKRYLSVVINEIFSKQNLILIFDSVLVVTIVGLILYFFKISNVWYTLALSFILTNLIFRLHIKKQFYSIVAGLYLIVLILFFLTKVQLTENLLLTVLTTTLFVFLFSVIIIYYRFIKEKVFIEIKTIAQLKEGDIPIDNYYYSRKKLVIKKQGFFKKIIEMANGTYYKDLRVDSNKACGITAKDIAFLKDMYKNKLIDNKIYLKKTIAFTPAVFLAFILIILF